MENDDLLNFKPKDLVKPGRKRKLGNTVAILTSLTVLGVPLYVVDQAIKAYDTDNTLSPRTDDNIDCDLGKKPVAIKLPNGAGKLLISRTTHESVESTTSNPLQTLGNYACVVYKPKPPKVGQDIARFMSLTVYTTPTSRDSGIYDSFAGPLGVLANTTSVIQTGTEENTNFYELRVPSNAKGIVKARKIVLEPMQLP